MLHCDMAGTHTSVRDSTTVDLLSSAEHPADACVEPANVHCSMTSWTAHRHGTDGQQKHLLLQPAGRQAVQHQAAPGLGAPQVRQRSAQRHARRRAPRGLRVAVRKMSRLFGVAVTAGRVQSRWPDDDGSKLTVGINFVVVPVSRRCTRRAGAATTMACHPAFAAAPSGFAPLICDVWEQTSSTGQEFLTMCWPGLATHPPFIVKNAVGLGLCSQNCHAYVRCHLHSPV